MPPSSHPLVTPGQLGAMLQAARKTQGLTQSALAARIGLSQSRVSHLELNAHELSVEQLLAVGIRDSAAVSMTPTTDW